MSHGYHEGMPGYHPDQLLTDGCEECEQRAARDSRGIAQLDTYRFARAWRRATQFGYGQAPHVSRAEAPLLNTLWAVQLQLEQRGIPIGTMPAGDTSLIP